MRKSVIIVIASCMLLFACAGLVACGGSGASSSVSYKDGSYEGVGKGLKGDIPVTVVVSGGKITAITPGENKETPAKFEAASAVISGIIEKQTVDGVDSVSGATHSSDGLKEAVVAALEKAK